MAKLTWAGVVWIPASAAAFVIAFRAAFIQQLTADMGPLPGTSTLLGSRPWWVNGLVFSLVLAAIAFGVTSTMRGRWVALLTSTLLSALLLAALYYALILQPVGAVLAG